MNGNPPNCTIDPNMPGNAVTSTKEAIAELELGPNEQALHPVYEHELHPENVDPLVNQILIVRIARKKYQTLFSMML